MDTDTPARSPAAAPGVLARDPRVAAAVAAVASAVMPPLQASWRDLSVEALVRVLEDLAVQDGARVLVVEPISGCLPVALGRLARAVTVVCSQAGRAGALAEQLSAADAANIELTTFAPSSTAAGGSFDRIVVLQKCSGGLPPALKSMLAAQGRAIIALDDTPPPRRMLRVMHIGDGEFVEDELDLTTFMPLLGDLLVDAGFVLRQEIVEATRAARINGRRLGEELLDRGAVREDDLYRMLAAQRQMPFVATAAVLARLDRDLARSLPRKYLDHYHFLPIAAVSGRVTVVTTEVDLPVWDLRVVFDGADVVAELTTPTDMKRIWTAIELGFVAQTGLRPGLAHVAAEEQPPTEDSRIVGLLDAIFLDAVSERASDIHLESQDAGGRLRFRIDGSLHDMNRYQLDNADLVAILNVIKIAAGLDIAERRVPQGGRLRRRIGGRLLDLRVQIQPTLYHECVVIRILPQDQKPPTIEDLGFAGDVADRYRRLLKNPHGLILVVGATGSGKSTTLYAGLQLLAKDTTRKVITIEDPIEYSLAGIQQTQVNPAVGFRFADAVRSFVRQDPDVILVGEIRDAETALEAIRAAQTGHLVLATLHCNDTVDAVQRLADLGMHPNSIASELTAVVAQRLARRICVACREATAPGPEILAELFPRGAPPDFRCHRGRGCDRCSGTGLRGRIAVVELLQVGPDLRRAISRNALVDDLRELARASGMRTLRASALQLVQTGVIPIEELYDVLSAEQMHADDRPD